MPVVKLTGYLTNIDKFGNFKITKCDRDDDKNDTEYKLYQLFKTGGNNPIKEDHFIVKSLKSYCSYQDDKPIKAEKLIGSLVEIYCEFRKYCIMGEYGWVLDLISIRNI